MVQKLSPDPGRSYMKDWELEAVLETVELANRKNNGGTFIEIGSAWGWTSERICRKLIAMKNPFSFWCVDPSPEAMKSWERRVKPIELPDGCTASFTLEPSTEAWKSIPPPYSFVLVDGCHCYDCVKADIENFGKGVSPGGFIVFHDVKMSHNRRVKKTQHDWTRCFGIVKAIELSELLAKNFWQTFWRQEDNGVGIYRRNAF